MINRPIGLDEIERAMTDNTPRPEPMSREQVLAVLEFSVIKLVADAVATLYERCEALERAASKLPLDAFNKDWEKMDAADFVDHSSDFLEAMDALRPLLTGTEASDAEGGG